jgi:predicted metal-dependent HD superfamily phosphohydrolase
MSDLQILNRKWQQYWIDSSGESCEDRQQIDRIFQLLVTAYTALDRYYHNLDHIQHLLTIVDRFNHQLQDPIAVSLAIWFHDFIYDSQASDNEIQSAEAAKQLLLNLCRSSDLIDRVQQLILATQGHRVDPLDLDLCIFLDADLAILGAEIDRYQVYQQSIRLEYSWVADEAYKVGRIQVLESFLQRDRLYYTDLLSEELESLARRNLVSEINSYSLPAQQNK